MGKTYKDTRKYLERDEVKPLKETKRQKPRKKKLTQDEFLDSMYKNGTFGV